MGFKIYLNLNNLFIATISVFIIVFIFLHDAPILHFIIAYIIITPIIFLGLGICCNNDEKEQNT